MSNQTTLDFRATRRQRFAEEVKRLEAEVPAMPPVLAQADDGVARPGTPTPCGCGQARRWVPVPDQSGGGAIRGARWCDACQGDPPVISEAS